MFLTHDGKNYNASHIGWYRPVREELTIYVEFMGGLKLKLKYEDESQFDSAVDDIESSSEAGGGGGGGGGGGVVPEPDDPKSITVYTPILNEWIALSTKSQNSVPLDEESSDYVFQIWKFHDGTLWLRMGDGSLVAAGSGHLYNYLVDLGTAQDAIEQTWRAEVVNDPTLFLTESDRTFVKMASGERLVSLKPYSADDAPNNAIAISESGKGSVMDMRSTLLYDNNNASLGNAEGQLTPWKKVYDSSGRMWMRFPNADKSKGPVVVQKPLENPTPATIFAAYYISNKFNKVVAEMADGSYVEMDAETTTIYLLSEARSNGGFADTRSYVELGGFLGQFYEWEDGFVDEMSIEVESTYIKNGDVYERCILNGAGLASPTEQQVKSLGISRIYHNHWGTTAIMMGLPDESGFKSQSGSAILYNKSTRLGNCLSFFFPWKKVVSDDAKPRLEVTIDCDGVRPQRFMTLYRSTNYEIRRLAFDDADNPSWSNLREWLGFYPDNSKVVNTLVKEGGSNNTPPGNGQLTGYFPNGYYFVLVNSCGYSTTLMFDAIVFQTKWRNENNRYYPDRDIWIDTQNASSATKAVMVKCEHFLVSLTDENSPMSSKDLFDENIDLSSVKWLIYDGSKYVQFEDTEFRQFYTTFNTTSSYATVQKLGPALPMFLADGVIKFEKKYDRETYLPFDSLDHSFSPEFPEDYRYFGGQTYVASLANAAEPTDDQIIKSITVDNWEYAYLFPMNATYITKSGKTGTLTETSFIYDRNHFYFFLPGLLAQSWLKPEPFKWPVFLPSKISPLDGKETYIKTSSEHLFYCMVTIPEKNPLTGDYYNVKSVIVVDDSSVPGKSGGASAQTFFYDRQAIDFESNEPPVTVRPATRAPFFTHHGIFFKKERMILPIESYVPPEKDWKGDSYVPSSSKTAAPTDAQIVVKITPEAGKFTVNYKDGNGTTVPATQMLYDLDKYGITPRGVVLASEHSMGKSVTQRNVPPAGVVAADVAGADPDPDKRIEKWRWLEATEMYLKHYADGSVKSFSLLSGAGNFYVNGVLENPGKYFVVNFRKSMV